jgi:hypothetical protein
MPFSVIIEHHDTRPGGTCVLGLAGNATLLNNSARDTIRAGKNVDKGTNIVASRAVNILALKFNRDSYY